MTMLRSTLRVIAITVPLVSMAAPALMAQDRALFTWTGRVDREVQLTMRGRELWSNGADRDDASRSRLRVDSPLPRTPGYVRVESSGRGEVNVVQQPSPSNDYTAIIRVRDRSSGSDRYQLRAYWDSRFADNRGGYGRDGGYSHDGGYGRDGGNQPNGVPERVDPRGNYGGGYNGNGAALRWSGSVDNEVEIRLQGRRLDERVLRGNPIRDERSAVLGDGVPRRGAQVVISQAQGRGTVYVAEQPSAYNGYTTVIRIKDPQGGYGFYNFEVDYR